MSDEEKKALERIDYIQDFIIENGQYNADVNDMEYFSKVLNLIEKQSKEIEKLSDKLTEKICKGVEEEILEEYRQTIISKDKEIEELKDESKEYQIGFAQGCYERDLDWKDKIKAKIEPKLKELDEQMKKEWKEYGNSREYQDMEDEWNFLQSLLEKE